jgi:hypothetical protein
MGSVVDGIDLVAGETFEQPSASIAHDPLSPSSGGWKMKVAVPPRIDGEEFHIVQCFTTQAALDIWRNWKDAAEWHERLRHVADHAPEYRVFNTTDLWFSATGLEGQKQPARWRMAVVTWMRIFPLASLAVAFLFPSDGPAIYPQNNGPDHIDRLCHVLDRHAAFVALAGLVAEAVKTWG